MLVVLCAIGLAASARALAQAGSPAVVAAPPQLAVDSQGRSVAATILSECEPTTTSSSCTNPRLLVMRHGADGSPDARFGTDGVVEIPVGAVENTRIFGLAIEPDGAILVGASSYGEPYARAQLARILPDGSLDEGFGSGGRQVVDPRLNPTNQGSQGIAALENGGFVVAGNAYVSTQLWAVARYGDDGRVVEGFGDAGVARFEFSAGPYERAATSVVTEPDGRVLVGGTVGTSWETREFAVARLTATGELDSGFGGGDGRVTLAPYTGEFPEARVQRIDALGDGRTVVVGTRNAGFHGGCPTATAARLGSDGSPDAGYGDGGLATEFPSCAGMGSAAVATDGAIAFVGNEFDYFDGFQPWAFTRLSPAGAPDPGLIGKHWFYGEYVSQASAIAADVRSGYAVAGTVDAPACVSDTPDGERCIAMALTRLRGDGTIDRDFGEDGLVTVPSIFGYVSEARLTRMIKRSLPKSMRISPDEAELRLKCPVEVRSSCTFALAAAARRRARVLGFGRARVHAGHTAVLVSAMDDRYRELSRRRRVQLHAEVKVPGRPKLELTRSVRVR